MISKKSYIISKKNLLLGLKFKGIRLAQTLKNTGPRPKAQRDNRKAQACLTHRYIRTASSQLSTE